jgi:excisionase family DNA binding protein
MDSYLTVEQAADRLGMSARFVRRLVAQRRIPFHKVGRCVRIALSDLDAFAVSTRVEAIDRADLRRQIRGAA